MEVLSITPQLFDIFGKRQLSYVVPSAKIFGGIISRNVDEAAKVFVENCMKIMRGQHAEVNQVYFSQTTNMLLSTDLNNITRLLIDVFTLCFNELSTEVQAKLNNNTFTVQDFLQRYQMIYNNSNVLKNCLTLLDNNLLNNKGERSKYSYVMLIKNYLFYAIVINKKYLYNGKNVYFYELLAGLSSTDFSNVLAVFRIYQFYNKLANSVSVVMDREKYFNKELNTFVITDSKTSQQFLNNVLNNVDDTVELLVKTTDSKLAASLLSKIRDMISMGNNVGDKTLFIVLYKSHLTERLRKSYVNPDVELELLSSLNYKDDSDEYAKMMYQIHDIKGSKQHTHYFPNIDVVVTSAKYKQCDVSKAARSKCNFTVMRSYAWDISAQQDEIKIPVELELYFEMFAKYYKERYNDRSLAYLYDQSTAEITLELSGKKYKLHMTLPQLFVLKMINDSGKVSAIDLSKRLGIPIKKLGAILNGFIKARLIMHGDGPLNDPNLIFFINTSCSFPDEKVSLVSLMRNPIQPPKPTAENTTVNSVEPSKVDTTAAATVAPQQEETQTEISDTALQAEILLHLVNNGSCNKAVLLKQLYDRLHIVLNSTRVENILARLVKSQRITQDGETYLYK